MDNIPLLTLWQIDPVKGPTVRLTSSRPGRVEQVPFPNKGVWIGGVGWYCTPIEASGVERTVGDVPTITLRVDLTEFLRERQRQGLFGPGTRVTRYMTDARAADRNNWENGRNPYLPNPASDSPVRVNHRTDEWVVRRVTQEVRDVLTMDLQDETAFWNQVIRPDIPGRCYHKYRGTACGYNGNKYWDEQNNSVRDRANDVCGLSIKSCELRFTSGSLPYGGVPQNLENK